MSPVQPKPLPPKRTNCGRPLYRFGYAKHKITLQTPCFEPTCNTCARTQPAVAAFEEAAAAAAAAVSSPAPSSYQDVVDAQQSTLLRRRRRQCEREVGERLRRVGALRAANAAAVKVREEEGGAKSGGRYGPRFRKRVVLRVGGGLSAYRMLVGSLRRQQQQRRSRRVVLKFERREAFGRLSRELAGRVEASPGEERRLFLVIGKNDTLRCRWE